MPGKFIISKFASDQMLKSGWVQGKGLGRNEDGISEPIKAKIKADNTGVGHDPGESFTYHWWDDAFRNSAKNIKVTEKNNEIGVEAVGKTEALSATKKVKKVPIEQLLYGSFLKSGTLENGRMTKQNSESSDSSDSEAGVKNKLLTDEELLAACGGRTAHKGARHGLKLSAKLARLQEQESSNLTIVLKKTFAPVQVPASDVTQIDDSNIKSKKRKKRKREKEDAVISSTCDVQCQNGVDASADSEPVKKKKKKSKTLKVTVETDAKLERKKKKKQKKSNP